MRPLSALLAAFALVGAAAAAPPPVAVLIVDGQNNHNWKATTPVLKRQLEATGRFTVDVATAPAKPGKGEKADGYKEAMAKFRPDLSKVAVVVSNYNGDPWGDAFNADFEAFVKNGGGLVSYHAADNAFPAWPAYNAMIGLGGWGGRTEKSGPYIRFHDGKVVKDETAGRGGSHGARHEFVVETVNADHPITKGLPAKWKHTEDELYDRLRGPAQNLTLLSVAYSDKAKNGTGEKEPMLFTIDYGKGRVFHTTLGHDVKSVNCVGFATTFARGVEWAATGAVTLPVPADFPTEAKSVPTAEK